MLLCIRMYSASLPLEGWFAKRTSNCQETLFTIPSSQVHARYSKQQKIKFVNISNSRQVCLYSEMEMTISIMQYVQFKLWQVFFLWVVFVCYYVKKVTIITNFHNLQLSSVILKVIHFVLSRINNLRTAISSIWRFYHVPPWKTTWHRFYSIRA